MPGPRRGARRTRGLRGNGLREYVDRAIEEHVSEQDPDGLLDDCTYEDWATEQGDRLIEILEEASDAFLDGQIAPVPKPDVARLAEVRDLLSQREGATAADLLERIATAVGKDD
jgi:hypothetical protein